MAGEFIHNDNKYFFLHIPKTGGKMWEHLYSNIGLTSGHGFVESKPEGYSFTIIRNPFDRLVSCFYYLKAGGGHAGDAEDALKYDMTHNSFEEWLRLAYKNPDHYLEQQHVMPMMRRIGKREYFDHIGLFENLEEETKKLHSIIYNETLEEVPVINKSNHKHFRDCYTDETASIVADLYQEDIRLYKELLNA